MERSIALPPHIVLELEDFPRRQGGGSSWKLRRKVSGVTDFSLDGPSVLQLAHIALGLGVHAFEQGLELDLAALQSLSTKAKDRLGTHLVSQELTGRKAADAAFWFALAGVSDSSLLHSLAGVCSNEIARFGSRESCRGKDIQQMLDRFAAAGLEKHEKLERAAREALAAKGTRCDDGMASSLLNFHSDRCLSMLWKFSTRQRKQRLFLNEARSHWEASFDNRSKITVLKPTLTVGARHDWGTVYKDPTRPLIVDIGCGMGVSLLGWVKNDSPSGIANSTQCNFAGVDLNSVAIGYAKGLKKTWNLADRLEFFVEDASIFLSRVMETYPGPVEVCMIQFPTPFRLIKGEEDFRGNCHLPVSATDGFMVSKRLLEQCWGALISKGETGVGKLLFQSNCQDVAVWIRRTACDECCFRCETELEDFVSVENHRASTRKTRPTKRSLDWIALGGEVAVGPGWSEHPLLPREAWTETEVACVMEGTPIFRCILEPVDGETSANLL